MNKEYNELGIGYAQSQRIARADRSRQTRKMIGYGIAGALVGLGLRSAFLNIRADYRNLEAEAQSAISANDSDAARRVIEKSDSTDMGCLYGGLYRQLQNTANQK